MKDFLMILPMKGQYYFEYLDTNRVNIEYYKKPSFIVRCISKINYFFVKRLPSLAIFNSFICNIKYGKKIISYLKKGYVASLDTNLEVDLLLYIKKKKSKFKLLIWNALSDEKANQYMKYLSNNDIYSYSKYDAIKYNFKRINDFYLIDLQNYYPVNDNPQFDLFFMGRDKGRIDIIEKITNILKEDGMKCKIQLLSNIDKTIGDIEYFKKYKSFDEYIYNLLDSKMLLDITVNSNITFRTIESFVFEKKLISNNKELVDMDFYNKNNIYIIDENNFNEEEFYNFLKLPFVKIDEDIKKRYDFYATYSYIESEFDRE